MSFRSEPFLWIHLAGFAVVPLSLQAMWLGLAVGEPLGWSWIELVAIAAIGIIPPLWMQLNRPFDIFSLLIVAIKPEQLTREQRQLLSLFKTRKEQFLAIIAAMLMLIVLRQLYQIAPMAAVAASFIPPVRLIGLLLAAVAFLVSNLFVQVPISVLGVLTTSEQRFAATEPLPSEAARQGLTVPGFRVNQILPTPVTKSTET